MAELRLSGGALDGLTLHYVSAGRGPAVVLLHGLGGFAESWRRTVEALAPRHTVIALDLPGFGHSAKPRAHYSLGFFANALGGFLDGLGLGSASLVGHSMGGAVALAVAARAPGRIASLTLIAPSGFGPEINAGYLRGFADAQTRRELKPVVGQLFADESLVTRQLVEDLLAYKRLDGVDEALHALADTLLDGDAQRGDPATAAAQVAALGGAVPVTVVWGRADRIIPAAQAEAVPGPVRRLIDGAGHMPHMERPAEVQAAIEETIARST